MISLLFVFNKLLKKHLNSSLQWRHNGHDGVSNHQPHHCLLNYLFGCRSKKTSKLRVIGLCAGNSPVPGEFPAQMASNAENVSIWWHHHADFIMGLKIFWARNHKYTLSYNTQQAHCKRNQDKICHVIFEIIDDHMQKKYADIMNLMLANK